MGLRKPEGGRCQDLETLGKPDFSCRCRWKGAVNLTEGEYFRLQARLRVGRSSNSDAES